MVKADREGNGSYRSKHFADEMFEMLNDSITNVRKSPSKF